MKCLSCSSLLLLLFVPAFSQEFTIHSNGLIYDEATIKHLHHIVDSLHLTQKSCGLVREYHALAQGKAHFIEIQGEQAEAAYEAIKAGISYENFRTRFEADVLKENLTVLRTYYEERNVKLVEVMALPEKHRVVTEAELAPPEDAFAGKWVAWYDVQKRYADSDLATLSAYWFTESMQRARMDDKYAVLLQYADCMIDTNTQIFLETASQKWARYFDNKADSAKRTGNKIDQAMSFADSYPGKPYQEDFKDYDSYLEAGEKWNKKRLAWLKDTVAKSDTLRMLFNEAYSQALKSGTYERAFEMAVGAALSKRHELQLLRSRIVYGQCSADASPRRHVQNIAAAAAESHSWDVFLRAHLDIMNDNVDRASDGSWAWGERDTYIREMEELGINVTDLLIGVCLRVDDAPENHYFASVSRTGRALAETRTPGEVEQKLLAMIGDEKLDDYNRLLLVYLFKHYNHHLKNQVRQKKNTAALTEAMKKMPANLSADLKPDFEGR